MAELRAALEGGAEASYLFFWGHQSRGGTALGPWCLSQWWPAAFRAEGEVFGSAEHYMMWRKARLFGDLETAGRILVAGTPAEAKRLGRGVRGYDEQAWGRERWDVVVAGSVQKFGSDESLRTHLVRTGERVLVEASPTDRIWGIGLAADSAEASSPALWRGRNLLGFALMEARSRLM